MKEVRKPVVGYEWLYEVSNLWNVKSINYKRSWTSSLMKLVLNKTWYYYVLLTKEWKKHFKRVHRLVALSFIPNDENKKEVNHKNGIKTYNSIKNLERVTPSENILHSIKEWLFKPNTEWLDKAKPCACIDNEWQILMEFKSITEAWIYFNCTRWSINNCILWRRKKIKSYKRIYI